jgi:hypothetical protein
MSTIITLINKAQALLEMNKDGEISAEKTIATLTKHIGEMAKAATKSSDSYDSSDSKKKTKKSKKSDSESDGDAPPKPKREPNDWIKFTSRVSIILKENNVTLPGAEQKQFCSKLKTIKPTNEWDNEDEILREREKWVKPDISKQEAAGKNKSSKSSRRSSIIEEEKKPEPEKKKPDPTKIEEKKKPAPTKIEEKKPEPEKKKPGRPKKEVKEVKAAATTDKDELEFDGFEHDGTLYLKSKEGYLLDTDGEWVGIYDGETIDEDAEQPEVVKAWCAKNE